MDRIFLKSKKNIASRAILSFFGFFFIRTEFIFIGEKESGLYSMSWMPKTDRDMLVLSLLLL